MTLNSRIAKLEALGSTQDPIFLVSNDVPVDRFELVGCRPNESIHFDRQADESESAFRHRCAVFAKKNTANGFLPVFFQEHPDGRSIF